MMSSRLALTISVLFASTWFGGIALAASTQGACRSGTMNATQYSSGSGTASGERFRPDDLTAAHKKFAIRYADEDYEPPHGRYDNCKN